MWLSVCGRSDGGDTWGPACRGREAVSPDEVSGGEQCARLAMQGREEGASRQELSSAGRLVWDTACEGVDRPLCGWSSLY